ncbi:MAG: ATP-binding protein [Pseudomonadota bacterium]
MQDPLSVLPSDGETIAELRELYRAAESRAARLRLLAVSARELAAATSATLDDVVDRCAARLAFFVGCKSATVVRTGSRTSPETAIPIYAPGDDGHVIAWLLVEGLEGLNAITDEEDREAFDMELDKLGLTIDRIQKERERAELLATLQEREKTLGKLLDQIFTAQEEERRRVSHELHDGVAQTATALVRMLESPKAGSSEDDAGIKPADIARSLVSELRRVIAGLRPTLLDDLGLVPALQALFDSLEADDFEINQTLIRRDVRLSPLIETAVFRVAQEAVANIRKHAGGPCTVSVLARFDSDPLLLRIEDDGAGPSEETRKSGAWSGKNIGIEVMKERMAALGGSLKWGAGDKRGVYVEARLPAEV